MSAFIVGIFHDCQKAAFIAAAFTAAAAAKARGQRRRRCVRAGADCITARCIQASLNVQQATFVLKIFEAALTGPEWN